MFSILRVVFRLSFSRSITLNRDQFGLVLPTSRSSAFAHFRLSTRNVLFSTPIPEAAFSSQLIVFIETSFGQVYGKNYFMLRQTLQYHDYGESSNGRKEAERMHEYPQIINLFKGT